MAINPSTNHLSIPASPRDRVPGIATTLNRRQCIRPDGTFVSARRLTGNPSANRRHRRCWLVTPPLLLKLFQDLVDGETRRFLARWIFLESLEEIRNYRLRGYV